MRSCDEALHIIARLEEAAYAQEGAGYSRSTIEVGVADLRVVLTLLRSSVLTLRATDRKLSRVQARGIELLTEHGVKDDCCAKMVTSLMHELLDLIAYTERVVDGPE